MLVVNCTFGSVGDSNLEKVTILQNLLTIRNNSTVQLRSDLHFFDNQLDDSLATYSIITGGSTYEINTSSESYVQWETGTYRFNPPDRIFGVLSQREVEVKTHTPFTLPLDLPTTDPFGRSYSFLNGVREVNFTQNTSSIDTGSTFRSTATKTIFDAPTGVISLATLTWENIYLRATITKIGTPNTVKTIKLLLGQGSATLRPKCKLSVNGSRQRAIEIGFQHSNLLRDLVERGVSVSFLQTAFNLSDSEIIITSISNTDLYSIVERNLKVEDLVINFPGCFPGVEK